MFRRRPTTLQDLKDNIAGQICAIQSDVLRNAVYGKAKVSRKEILEQHIETYWSTY